MKQALLSYGFAAVIASSLLITSPSSAKTVKACEDEWKTNKSTLQASGKKRKDFITECRAETASAEPAAAPAAQPAPAETSNSSAAPPRTRFAKTLRACGAEWIANKETLQASGKTRKDFITECRAGTETTAAATAPSEGMTPGTAPAAGKKTAKACEADWKANKASIQASGKKKTDFMTECRAEPASTQTAAAPAPQPAPAQQPKSEVAAAPRSAPAAEPKSEVARAPKSATAAEPKSEASTPCSTGPGQFAHGRSIYDGDPSENALPGRHGGLGQYALEDLSLRFKPRLRPHKDGRIHVRERNRSSRPQGCQEGEAPVKKSARVLLLTACLTATARVGARAVF